MSEKTGEKCVSAGRYHCQTHRTSVISIKAGDTFPMCNPRDEPAHNTTWVKDAPV
jgi:hypothetical protein